MLLPWVLGALAVTMPMGQGARAPAREKVEVDTVLAMGPGHYVVMLKTLSPPARYLPVVVGENEAVAIQLRLERQQPARPLTLNLLESVLDSGRIQLVEVVIDDVRDGVLLGTLRLKQNARRWQVEARPSDAIGLALGRRTAIWVVREVLERAALELEGATGADAGSPASSQVAGDTL